MPIPAKNLEPYKRKLIQLIHVAKSKLGLDDATYRDLVRSFSGGKDSSKALGISQLEAILDHLRARGFKETKTYRGKALENDPQSQKIRSLWLELKDAGELADSSEEALAAFVKRQTGVESLRWLDSWQASAVIESLKKWIERL